MNKTMKTIVYREPVLRRPYLICGLPGIGYVAKLSADYLKTQLNAELFEEVYSPSFPPYVLIRKNGIVELLKNEFYFWKNESSSEHDLIIFSGNVQAGSPEGQFEIVEEILKLATNFGVSKIFSIAAYVRQQSIDAPKVFGAVTHQDLIPYLKKFGVDPMEEGSISGTNGLLFGHAKLGDIQSICLLGETPFFSRQVVVDAKAAKAVLAVLTKMLKIKIDMEPLEKQAKLTEDFVNEVEEVSRRAIDEMQKAQEREVPRYYV